MSEKARRGDGRSESGVLGVPPCAGSLRQALSCPAGSSRAVPAALGMPLPPGRLPRGHAPGRCGTRSRFVQGCQDAAGSRKGALESLVVTARKQTAPVPLFIFGKEWDRHRSRTAVSDNQRLCSVPLADLLCFWRAVLTFLAVRLLFCVTLAVSSQHGFSVLPIFLYNCIAVSSS